jgi:hypothetical protein
MREHKQAPHLDLSTTLHPKCLRPSQAAWRRWNRGQTVSIRQHKSAYVSRRQHTSAYVSIRQQTSAYVSIHQHTSAYLAPMESRPNTASYDPLTKLLITFQTTRQQLLRSKLVAAPRVAYVSISSSQSRIQDNCCCALNSWLLSESHTSALHT